ncbi:MAG: hypothetical protein M0R06_19015 [Sphaerochaeta sp.]|jgi:uncharacterized Fe-S cluster-containing protein|nr:hypothetical protein [Sphaerochaeta sp.]
MPFYNEADRKEMGYFYWEDGKKYVLTVQKAWTEGNAKAEKWPLKCENQETGDIFRINYAFDLMNALDKLAGYDDGMVVNVVSHDAGPSERLDKNGVPYRNWKFDVSLFDAVESAQDAEERRKEAAANLE